MVTRFLIIVTIFNTITILIYRSIFLLITLSIISAFFATKLDIELSRKENEVDYE